MKLTSLTLIFCTFCFSQTAFAQQTPRDRMIEQLEAQQMDARDQEAHTAKEPGSDMPAASAVQGQSSVEILDDEDISEPVESAKLEGNTPTNEAVAEPVKTIKTTVPFYVSASDYLDIRGDAIGTQLVLKYHVEVETFGSNTPVRMRTVTIVIGDDYAATTSGHTTKIYDFKLNRLLTLAPYYEPDGTKSEKVQFDNVSLYAKAYRDMSAVRGATQGGTQKKVQIGRDKFIDKFWVESAMSWAAAPPEMALVIDEDVDSLSISRDKHEVFTAEFDENNYSTAAIKDSFLIFAHHELSIHPLALKRLASFDRPIKYMEITAFGPSTPEGQKQIWSLTGRKDTEAGFPLPRNALSVTARKPVMPIVFVINEAAQGRALNGKKSPAILKAKFDEKFENGDEIGAWFVGQEYLAHTGIDCEQEVQNSVCAGVLAYESAELGEHTHVMQRYFRAAGLSKDKSSESRIELIKTIRPNLDDQSAPAFIYRLAAMARAKLTKEQAAEAELTALNAEALLKLSLAKDPYDPNTYVGLAQVLAAKGAFEQSWDIYDALRAGFPLRTDLSMKINRVEKNLRATAPGYFMQE